MTAKKPAAKKPAAENAVEAAPAAKLVRMVRGEVSADVHPDEVENYAAGGWTEA